MTLTLEFAEFFENFNIGINFWTVDAKTLVFHMIIILWDKIFLRVP